MSKGRARWFCRACDKWAYGSQGRAHETIHRFADTGREYVPVRAYQCQYGNGWHLTSTKEYA